MPSLDANSAGSEDNARDRPESDTTSSTETEAKNEIGRRYLDSAKGSWKQGLTVLEPLAVKQGSQKLYLREWNELLHRVTLTADQTHAHSGNDLDSIIVKHFEKLFFEGEQPTRRMNTLGARVTFCTVSRRPRSASKLVCAEGMENTLPRLVEDAELLGIWCATRNALARDGHQCMRLFLMLSVSTYLRPGLLMRLQGNYIVNPHASTLGNWSLLVDTEEQNVVAKRESTIFRWFSTIPR